MRTRRLVLRRWSDDDREPFAELNSDVEVMRHIGGPVSRTASDASVDHFDEHWAEWGYGVLAVEQAETGLFIGFVGLNHHRLFPNDVEIGWRLRRDCWGQGLATEGAGAVAEWAFGDLGLPRLIAVTTPANAASLRVMAKVGMSLWRDTSPEGKTL
jgi:RimJ/RimL family protein N-acetyltransferase